MREWFVIDGSGHISYGKDNEPEAFGTLQSATKRANELARSEAGHTVVIARSAAYVTCQVAKPTITMRKLR